VKSPSQNQKLPLMITLPHPEKKNKIRNVLNENTKKIAEDGKEILIRKLKHLKIT
jgi:GTP pyrophosphokinase